MKEEVTNQSGQERRNLNPDAIKLPKGYKIEVFSKDLTTPINMIFTDNGEILVGDAGVASGNGRVLKLKKNDFEVLAEGFNPPLTGITMYKGDLYVAHRGFITVVRPDGSKEDILEGLPSWGDHHNNRVVFGPDEKMYFGQGTATNSGVVGVDNMSWVKEHPYFHDYPGDTIMLRGQNFVTDDYLSKGEEDIATTGAFSPFNVPNYSGEWVKGVTRASGSILRANPDGSDLEILSWGLRNPFRIAFDDAYRLFTTNHGMDVRGSRPVAYSPDEFYLVNPGSWYGWPDYTGGLPVTLPVFKPEDESQPSFLLAYHPMTPPKPLATFQPHSAIMGFDFNYTSCFRGYGDVYIAEFGSMAPRTTGGKPLPKVGHRVSRVELKTGKVYIFARNHSGYPASHDDGGGLETPIDVVFGPKEAMYIVDFGVMAEAGYHGFVPETGVIWKVTKG